MNALSAPLTVSIHSLSVMYKAASASLCDLGVNLVLKATLLTICSNFVFDGVCVALNLQVAFTKDNQPTNIGKPNVTQGGLFQ